ncbi:hypothetical protein [Aerolutibacter ruishenii]|uniref:Outer membrane lipoprotein-sorting protein n=1 Tax=Aerolutibacter ruishenii TaxID=686800 RepID=A0A562LYN9_9GAMM|nr:hypothetical protein [Lysobacter ruishenii]TWI12765.1 hypothetical protein IP93_01111 [Lysobacter ruishenii]
MFRTVISSAVLASAGVMGLVFAVPNDPQLDSQPMPVFHAAALDRAAESRAEGELAMDDSVATSLVGAITLQFPRQQVEVQLDKVDVAPLSVRDRVVSGEGRLRIGDDDTWIPLAFNALYDTQDTVVTQPRLVLGSDAPSSMVSSQSPLVRGLLQQVSRAMAAEFIQQAVEVRIDHASTSPAGRRYLHVQAVGQARFEGEGMAPASIEALYDRTTGQWLRVNYDLDAAAPRDEPARS